MAKGVKTNPGKRISVFLDGTWNTTGDNTNVWRLSALCAPVGADGVKQITRYDIGVNGLWGGGFGKGVSANMLEAYEWLVGQYDPGDEIFIFGFSRGAFTARSLAGLIAKYGLLKPGSPLSFRQLYERYRRSDDKTIWRLAAEQNEGSLANPALEDRWLLAYSMPTPIKFVGVWDTVGALGVPWFSFEGISRSTFGWMHTGLRLPIQHGFHAVAVDEHRRSFKPTLWTVVSTTKATPRSLSSVEQRWFPGNHGNVGGGYPSDLLVQAPLRWLKGKAESLGLAFRYDVDLDTEMHRAPIQDSHGEFMRGLYGLFSRPLYRTIAAGPVVDPRGTHTTVNESLDGSVFDRWRHNQLYRPPNLVEWGRRYKLDPADIQGSVLAHDPSVSVPD